MKYCMSGRQPFSVLKKADEIKVQFKDYQRILDFIEKIPDKTVILDVPKGETIDVNFCQMVHEKMNFVIAVEDLYYANIVRDCGFKWYWSYPVTSYYELNTIAAMNPEYILLGPPLCFDLEAVRKKTNAILRLIANVADVGYLPRENGIYGPWIRPEDVELYEEYVSVLEFRETDLSKEQTLLHIYQDNKMWPGNLNLLLMGFGVNVDNRALPEEIGSLRMKCGQRCMSRGTCNFCYTAVQFAEALRKAHENQKRESKN